MKKYLNAALLLATYLIVSIFVYFIHARFFKVDVVFYAAIMDALIAVVITSLLFFNTRFSIYNGFEKASLIAIFILTGYALSISVPTVLDRSLSFYILEKIDQRGGIQLHKFEQVFTQEYLVEHRLVDVRLTEQLASGTIEISEGCVRLTPKGQKLAKFSRFFRLHALPKKRLLMGEYSDDLTDPFKNSTSVVDYNCR